MKLIPLGKSGFFAKVDDADFKWLSMWEWRLHTSGSGRIDSVARGERISGKYVSFLMHRVIMNVVDPKVQIDHINGDVLDNQKRNLRYCNNQQNNLNKGRRKDNNSGAAGVGWHKRGRKWRARICLNGEQKSLGLFDTIEEATAARNQAVLEMHGEFGRLSTINN